MDGKSTDEGKSGDSGKGGITMGVGDDGVGLYLMEQHSQHDEGLDEKKAAVLLDDGMRTTMPIVLAIGYAVTSSRSGSGGVPSSLAESVLKTRYQAYDRTQDMDSYGDPGGELLGVTEVAVITMEGLRVLLRAAGLGEAIGLGLTDNSK